ncbi:hypothetical protein Tco_0661481 [Tanacetum coccineum]
MHKRKRPPKLLASQLKGPNLITSLLTIQPWLSNLARKEDPHESFDELMDTPLDFSTFVMNRLHFDPLTPELLAGLTFKLMKGTFIPFDHFINNDIVYLCGGVSSRTYTTSITKTKAADYGHIKWIEELAPNTMESARDITVRRDDDKLYTFKEGDFKRLHLQDIEDMLILLVQGKMTNLNVEERLNFSVSLRMFTRKQKQEEKLMHIDELHKFSDGTLDDVWTALNDRLKGIRMKYLPHTIWRQSDRERAAAMIQAIDKQLKSRRIMRSLEIFVGGRPYGGDLRLLQRTI